MHTQCRMHTQIRLSAALRHSLRAASRPYRTHIVTMAATVDASTVREDWRRRGFSFGVFVDPPGRVWPDFVHDTDELVMLEEGDIQLEFGGRTLRPAVGEEVLIPAKTPHTVENVGSTTNRWLYGYKKK